MNILFASSEAVPFAVSGGLAEVAGALPKALKAKGEDVRVILPLYGSVTEEQRAEAQRQIDALEISSGKSVRISVEPFKSFYSAEEEHQDYYLKHPEEFEQELISSGRKKA